MNFAFAESKEEYVSMNETRRPENAYDIYESAASLQQKDENKCPYTGLPAAHLKIMNSTQAGLLTRIEKKLFFAQSKDFYAGILEKWILLYPSKSNDMKPSECFYPKSIENEKADNQFSVVTNSGKRFHFQAPNADEFSGWMESITNIIEENCKLRATPTSQLSFRKLPSPPPDEREGGLDSGSSSENYYGFNRSSNQTVIHNDVERLYEDPRASRVEVGSESMERDAGEEKEEEGEKPPSLPVKTGKKVKDDEVHGYDVPKPTIAVDRAADSEIAASEKIEDVQCEDKSSPPSPAPTETPDKSRTKVSEMTAILSSINLVSPEERKSTHTPKSKKIATADKPETEKGEKRVSPMKSWFAKQISKNKKRRSKRELTPEVDDEQVTSVKGPKVNKIINQLEKNGLSKSLKNRKSSAFDGEDYETVCVRN